MLTGRHGGDGWWFVTAVIDIVAEHKRATTSDYCFRVTSCILCYKCWRQISLHIHCSEGKHGEE